MAAPSQLTMSKLDSIKSEICVCNGAELKKIRITGCPVLVCGTVTYMFS